jgi:uncharacterized membrane protein
VYAGVELFIFLCIVLFIMALCPLVSIIIHRKVSFFEKKEALCPLVSIIIYRKVSFDTIVGLF